MYEVADRWYTKFIPEVRALADRAERDGKTDAAKAVRAVVDEVMSRPEHAWQKKN
jgi:hydroxylamine dehydrogenase